MYGHFVDLKQAYVMGMMEALQRYDISLGVPFLNYKKFYAMNAVHTYIRTMRTGYTVQSSYADKQLREVMWQYAQYGYRCDEDTIAAIAEETQITPKNVEEILMGGLLKGIEGIHTAVTIYIHGKNLHISRFFALSQPSIHRSQSIL